MSKCIYLEKTSFELLICHVHLSQMNTKYSKTCINIIPNTYLITHYLPVITNLLSVSPLLPFGSRRTKSRRVSTVFSIYSSLTSFSFANSHGNLDPTTKSQIKKKLLNAFLLQTRRPQSSFSASQAALTDWQTLISSSTQTPYTTKHT